MTAHQIEIDPVKLMRWLNARKLTVPAFCATIGIDPDRLGEEIARDVLTWDEERLGRASEVLDVAVDQLAGKPAVQTVVHRSAAVSATERRTVRRDGIDFYNYYTLAGPRGEVAPVILDIRCPRDRLPQLNQGHLEPAITVNLGPGDINGRWGTELTADTWSVLAANDGDDRWICGDTYFEPSFCPHSYSLAGDRPASILSYTGFSPLSGLVDRTDTWPANSFAGLLEDVGERYSPASALRQAMRRRMFDAGSLSAMTGVDTSDIEAFLGGAGDALDLPALRRVADAVRCDYRLLLPIQADHDRVGKSSCSVAQSRATIRTFEGYTVADMAGSPAAPDLLGQFVRVARDGPQGVTDLRDPAATFYIVADGVATATWRDAEGALREQSLVRWDSLWIGPGVEHGFTGSAGLLRMGDASAFSASDTMELGNTYRPAWTLGRAHKDRQGWGYDA